MTPEEIIAFAGVIGIPLLIFALHAVIDRRVAIEIKAFRRDVYADLRLKEAQIEQLQHRIAVLQARLGDDPETFIRSLPNG